MEIFHMYFIATEASGVFKTKFIVSAVLKYHSDTKVPAFKFSTSDYMQGNLYQKSDSKDFYSHIQDENGQDI